MHIADMHACAHIVATDPEAVNGSEQSIIDACITEWGVCRAPDLQRIICEGVYDQDQVPG